MEAFLLVSPKLMAKMWQIALVSYSFQCLKKNFQLTNSYTLPLLWVLRKNWYLAHLMSSNCLFI
jgi:hypothetical protein